MLSLVLARVVVHAVCYGDATVADFLKYFFTPQVMNPSYMIA